MIAKNGFCSLVIFVGITLQGCASLSDKALITSDLQSVNQIKVVRYEFPGWMKETTGSNIASAAIVAPFIIFGAIGGGIGGGLAGSVKSSMMKSAGKEIQEKYNLPDFTELIYKGFAEKLPQNLTDWPQIVMEPVAVSDDYQSQSGCLLSIRSLVIVSDDTGLQADTTAQLVDPTQKILWRKRAVYKSSDFKRPCTFEELEADNAKAMKGEIDFAVEKTISELVDDLRNGTDAKAKDSTEPERGSIENPTGEGQRTVATDRR